VPLLSAAVAAPVRSARPVASHGQNGPSSRGCVALYGQQRPPKHAHQRHRNQHNDQACQVRFVGASIVSTLLMALTDFQRCCGKLNPERATASTDRIQRHRTGIPFRGSRNKSRDGIVMKNKGILVFSLLSMHVLGGCGGSSAPEAATKVAQSFATRSAAFSADVSRLRNVGPTAQMPNSGKASYKGSVGFSGNPTVDLPTVIGNVTLNADFGASTVGGTLSDFVSETGPLSSGPVLISNGLIAGNAITADITGNNPLLSTASPLTGSIQGSFLGSDASSIAGTIVGSSPQGALYGRMALDRH
jgi:hypothetical protein